MSSYWVWSSDDPRIVYLDITTWGYAHYYGTIRCVGKKVDVLYTLTDKDAAHFNFLDKWQSYEAGDSSARFPSRELLIKEAVVLFREEFCPPGIVLIEGRNSVIEPQPTLFGFIPSEDVDALNAIWKQCEDLGWWDHDADAIEDLCRTWYDALRVCLDEALA